MNRYARLAHAVVLRFGGRMAAAVAEDVVQQVFLELWRQLERGRRIQHPASYIHRSTVRETIRTLKRERRHGAAHDDSDLLERLPDPSRGPHERADGREVAAAVSAVASGLAPPRARAVRGHLFGLSVGEIMGQEGWSYQRARNLVARGMADLRRGLEAQDLHGDRLLISLRARFCPKP